MLYEVLHNHHQQMLTKVLASCIWRKAIPNAGSRPGNKMFRIPANLGERRHSFLMPHRTYIQFDFLVLILSESIISLVFLCIISSKKQSSPFINTAYTTSGTT
jgi:hypothetical protein